MEKIIVQYGQHMYELGYSRSRQRSNPLMVAEFLEQQRIGDIGTVSREQVRGFYTYLESRPSRRGGGISAATIAKYMGALNHFFEWLMLLGEVGYNPLSAERFRGLQGGSREALSEGEVAALFGAVQREQERAVLHLCYSCGLRRSEAVALNIRDVHFRDGLLYVREGKGKKRRVIPLPKKVSEGLKEYYEQERLCIRAATERDGEAFILNNRGVRMRGKEYNSRIKRLVERSGIGKPEVSLHHLRHSIATHLLQGGMPMVQVRDFLGHNHLNTTQIYARAGKEQLNYL